MSSRPQVTWHRKVEIARLMHLRSAAHFYSIVAQKLNVIIKKSITNFRTSLVAQRVKNLPAMPETWVCSLGWEDPLEKGKATHSSILAWRIPWTPWGCKELDMIEQLSLYFVRSILHLDL